MSGVDTSHLPGTFQGWNQALDPSGNGGRGSSWDTGNILRHVWSERRSDHALERDRCEERGHPDTGCLERGDRYGWR